MLFFRRKFYMLIFQSKIQFMFLEERKQKIVT